MSALLRSGGSVSTTKWLGWTAGLSILAGIMHGALVDEHLEESIAVGGFFVISALAQGIFGFAILASHLMNGTPISERWPPRALNGWYAAGIAGNLLLVALYLASRTIGVAGDIEAWSAVGIFVKLLETAIVVILVILLSRRRVAPAPMPAMKPA